MLASTEGSEGLKRTLVTDSADVEKVMSITGALLAKMSNEKRLDSELTLSRPKFERSLKTTQILDPCCDGLLSYKKHKWQ